MLVAAIGKCPFTTYSCLSLTHAYEAVTPGLRSQRGVASTRIQPIRARAATIEHVSCT